MTVTELEEKLLEGEVKLYQWLSTKEMWADGLTKEMEMAEGLRKLLRDGKCEMVKMEDDQNGRLPKWKTPKMEDDKNGRRPKWKTTKMEDDPNGRRPKWKTSRMEDDQNG